MSFRTFFESLEDREFYHVTANKNLLMTGKRGSRIHDLSLYEHPDGFCIWDNIEDAQWTLEAMKRAGHLNSEIVVVHIPPEIKVKEDHGAIGRAFYTNKFDPAWIV